MKILQYKTHQQMLPLSEEYFVKKKKAISLIFATQNLLHLYWFLDVFKIGRYLSLKNSTFFHF